MSFELFMETLISNPMLNLEQAMKVANGLYKSTPKVSYDGKVFAFSCNHTYFTGETINDIVLELEKQLFESWKVRVLMPEAITDNVESLLQHNDTKDVEVVVKSKDDNLVLKTRKDWSIGKKGDPRKKKKGYVQPFTKTQILEFMRKAQNGKYSSELISFDQYVEEFLYEYKKAKSRRNWHNNKHKYKIYLTQS